MDIELLSDWVSTDSLNILNSLNPEFSVIIGEMWQNWFSFCNRLKNNNYVTIQTFQIDDVNIYWG